MTENTIYNKLVRDKVPEIIRANGDECEYVILSPAEYKKVLLEKCFEEIEEYKNAKPEKRADELADILEITEALANIDNITADELYKVKTEKKEKRGGFLNKIFLIRTF